MMLVLLMAMGLAVVAGQVGRILDDSAQARTAADAAALAGAVQGRAAAVQYAEMNEAELVEFERTAHGVTVRVRVGRATATSDADATVVWRPGSNGG